MLSQLAKRAPGLAAAACTAGGGAVVAKSLPADWHVNSVPASIVLGAAAANAAPAAVREAIAPGLKFATSTILRSGIVLVGAKLSAAQVLALGWTTVPAAACSVGAGVVAIPMLAARAGLTPKLGALLAAGTSICGVTAIGATAPAIAATQAEVAVAVANVVAFGSFGMLAYPHVAHALFPEGDSKHKGLFIGLAVHDTAQVMGCAASYAEQYAEEAVVSAAAVAKLTRNVFLAGVVPLMAVRHGGAAGASSFAAALPTFVLGFVGAAGVRSLGDTQCASGGRAFGVFAADEWKANADWLGGVLGTKILLATGLAGVGLSVDAKAFRSAGLRRVARGRRRARGVARAVARDAGGGVSMCK